MAASSLMQQFGVLPFAVVTVTHTEMLLFHVVLQPIPQTQAHKKPFPRKTEMHRQTLKHRGQTLLGQQHLQGLLTSHHCSELSKSTDNNSFSLFAPF